MRITSRSIEETYTAAARTAGRVRKVPVISLNGQLGAGKTIFAKGLAMALGIKDPDVVTSPTFTLIHEYKKSGRPVLYHMDFYRLESEEQARPLGLEEYFSSGIPVVVEWGDKFSGLLPSKHIHVEITLVHETERIIDIKAPRR